MIGWRDVYNVVVAMAPLYVALLLGYGSVKWWRLFKPDHCDAINRFNCYFVMPFFTFKFTAAINPYIMNFRFLAGDVIAKAIAGVALALWANLAGKGNFAWAITSFSLSSLNNTLVVGVPLLGAMYGAAGADLVVQSFVIQALLWFPTLLFLLELWRTSFSSGFDSYSGHQQSQVSSIEIVAADANNGEPPENQNNGATAVVGGATNGAAPADRRVSSALSSWSNFRSTMKKVLAELVKNPNIYACAVGFIWALLARKWHFGMPSIMEGSILIMAKAGSGLAMFSMGLFMALQDKIIACGVKLTIYGMILRFVVGPLATAIGCLALGLRSNILKIAIVQAALPQSITAFVFAQEYGLHANVLSTAVIFGTIASLPILIADYAILEVV